MEIDDMWDDNEDRAQFTVPRQSAPPSKPMPGLSKTEQSLIGEIKALRAERDLLREALAQLTHNASEVNRLGAKTGTQWLRLTGAILIARAALGEQL